MIRFKSWADGYGSEEESGAESGEARQGVQIGKSPKLAFNLIFLSLGLIAKNHIFAASIPGSGAMGYLALIFFFFFRSFDLILINGQYLCTMTSLLFMMNGFLTLQAFTPLLNL